MNDPRNLHLFPEKTRIFLPFISLSLLSYFFFSLSITFPIPRVEKFLSPFPTSECPLRSPLRAECLSYSQPRAASWFWFHSFRRKGRIQFGVKKNVNETTTCQSFQTVTLNPQKLTVVFKDLASITGEVFFTTYHCAQAQQKNDLSLTSTKA